MISAGGLYPIAFDVYDTNNALTHATSATLVITLPDGTTASPAITDPDVPGQYRLLYQTTIAGRYTAHAVTTGPVTSWDDEWDAAATPWPAIVSLADAKQQLNMDPADHTYDDELREYIAGVTGAVEDYKHQVIARRAVTDEIDLGCGWGTRRFRVRSAPVISLTSVTSWDAATTWDVTQMRVSPSGTVRVMNGPWVRGVVDVAYVAGLQVIPARYKRGALVVLQHAWETQRGQLTATAGVLGPEDSGGGQPGMYFTIPNKAKEWLGPPRPVLA